MWVTRFSTRYRYILRRAVWGIESDKWESEVESVTRAEMRDGWVFVGSSGDGVIC